MADPARTIDPAEAVDLATRRHEPVIIERDGSALAAVIPIDLFEKRSGESGTVQASLVDELLAISSSVPNEGWAELPEDGAENVDQYLHAVGRHYYFERSKAWNSAQFQLVWL